MAKSTMAAHRLNWLSRHPSLVAFPVLVFRWVLILERNPACFALTEVGFAGGVGLFTTCPCCYFNGNFHDDGFSVQLFERSFRIVMQLLISPL